MTQSRKTRGQALNRKNQHASRTSVPDEQPHFPQTGGSAAEPDSPARSASPETLFASRASAFRAGTETVRATLRPIVRALDSCAPPSDEEVEALASSLADLRSRYEDMHHCAADLLGADVPAPGTPLGALEKAVRQRDEVVRETLTEGLDILASFQKVRSSGQAFQRPLAEEQQKAAALAERLSARLALLPAHGRPADPHSNVEPIGRLEAELRPYRLFMEALTCDADRADSAAMEALEGIFQQLDTCLPGRLVRALYSGMYSLPGTARRILPVETGQDAGAARDALIDTTVPAPDDDLLRELDRRAGKKIFRYVTRLVARLCVLTGAQARDYAELLCKGGSKGLAKVDDALDFLLEGRFLREVFLDRGGSAPALLAGKPFLDRMHSEADAMQQALLSPFPQEESLSGMIAPRSVRRALACNDSELRYLKGVRSHEKKKLFRSIAESCELFGGGRTVIQWRHELTVCSLALPGETLPGGENWLMVPEGELFLPRPAAPDSNCFAWHAGSLHHWERDAWVPEKSSSYLSCFDSGYLDEDEEEFADLAPLTGLNTNYEKIILHEPVSRLIPEPAPQDENRIDEPESALPSAAASAAEQAEAEPCASAEAVPTAAAAADTAVPAGSEETIDAPAAEDTSAADKETVETAADDVPSSADNPTEGDEAAPAAAGGETEAAGEAEEAGENGDAEEEGGCEADASAPSEPAVDASLPLPAEKALKDILGLSTSRIVQYRLLGFFLSFAVLTEDQLQLLLRQCGKSQRPSKGKLREAVRFLVSAGFVKRIERPVPALMLCGEAREAMAAGANGSSLPMPDTGIVLSALHGPMVPEKAVLSALARTDCLNSYISSLLQGRAPHWDELVRDINKRLPSRMNTRSVPVWFGTRRLCDIALTDERPADGGQWLFLPTDELPALDGVSGDTHCFAYLDGVFHHWEDGCWVTEENSVLPADESEAESDHEDELEEEAGSGDSGEDAGEDSGSAEEVPDSGPLVDASVPLPKRHAFQEAMQKSLKDRLNMFVGMTLINFQVITAEQMERLADICFPSQNVSRYKLMNLRTYFVGKGYAKRIETPVQALILCGTSRDRFLEVLSTGTQQSETYFELFDRPSLRGPMVPEAAILRCLAENDAFIRYLDGLRKSADSKAKRLMALYRGNVGLLATPQKLMVSWGDDLPCTIALEDQQPVSGRDWLYAPERELPCLHDVPEDTECFAWFEGRPYHWEDGAWEDWEHTLHVFRNEESDDPAAADSDSSDAPADGESVADDTAADDTAADARTEASDDQPADDAAYAAGDGSEAGPAGAAFSEPCEADGADNAPDAAQTGEDGGTDAETAANAGMEAAMAPDAAAGADTAAGTDAEPEGTDAGSFTDTATSSSVPAAGPSSGSVSLETSVPNEALSSEHADPHDGMTGSSPDSGAGASLPDAAGDNDGEPSEIRLIARLAASLAEEPNMPPDTEIRDLALRLLDAPADPAAESADGGDAVSPASFQSRAAQALMLLQAACLQQKMPECERLARELSLACGIAAEPDSYAGYNLNNVFAGCGAARQSLALAAYMHALFAPSGYRDFTLTDQARDCLSDFETYFPAFGALKPLFTLLLELKQTDPRSFSPAVLAQLEDADEQKQIMQALQKRAAELVPTPGIKTYMHGIPELLSRWFGPQSDMHEALSAAAANDGSQRDLARLILEDYGSFGEDGWTLDDKELEERIDSAWGEATKGLSTQGVSLNTLARRMVRQTFVERLEMLRDWLETAEPIDAGLMDRLRALRNRILKEIDALPSPLAEPGAEVRFPGLCERMVRLIRSRLEQKPLPPFHADALRTGFIMLDDHYAPQFSQSMCSVHWYEPWRRVLKHIACPAMTLAAARDAICGDPNSDLFDNLNQLALIGRLRGEDCGAHDDAPRARRRASELTEKFKGDLELDYASGRINEQDKEDLLQFVICCQEEIMDRDEFGCWKQFLKAVARQKTDLVNAHRTRLADLIEKRRAAGRGSGGQSGSSILTAAEKYLADGEFAMAEEYLNLYDSNDGEYEAEIRKELEREDSFARFLQDFPDYAETCSRTQNRRLAQAVEQFVKEHYPDDWTVRLKKDSASFLKTWPHRKGTTQAQDITAFVRGLGITVGTASRISDREEVFELQVEPADRNLADYPHPFAAFGTQLGTPLYVVVMYGMHLPRNLPGEVNALKRLSRTGMNIVLLDHTLTLEQRRQLAEACHQKSDSTRFIVIDRILALYLAMCSQAERLSTLLNCALPFAAALQPFVRDGGMTPEEMFVGRTRELADIINFNGATLVYGGRQLGKTALLYRARSRCHVPANRDFAIVCSIKGLGDEALAAQAFADAVNKESKLAIRDCSTVKAFCDQIEKRFADGRIQSLRLMIDEADAFLNGIAEQDYAPVGALIALMRSCPRFKFVLAGLNNVYRARRATGNNGDFGQLGQPLCITPLSPAIALGFILRPLRYLGFQPAQDAQLATILSSTNYYPGILHFFGYIIVQSLNEKYGLYYKAAEGNPPFILKKELLGSIMNSSELNSSICDKFRLSLKLDERYYMLARCLGIIYHMGEPMLDGYKGYSVDTIKRMAEYYGIHCLVRLNRSEYMALLDEMTEMGILHRAEEGVYRLRKRSFLDIIGSDMDRLEAEIIDENTAEAEA